MSDFFSVRGLSVNVAEKKLLSDISFSIEQGDYLCVLGANGAGKSTLLKALIGITQISAGDIEITQTNTKKLSQKQLSRLISYVPQALNQALFFKAGDFIKMGRYPYHSAFSEWNQQDQKAYEHALKITHTEAFVDRPMQTLSGGENQRVMIAAAVCQQTPILLLDEPTSFLDPHHQIEVHHLIRELNQQHNISIIEVSHDLNHAAQHSQHILALKQGKRLWYGKSEAFMCSEQLSSLYDQEFVFTKHPQTGVGIALPSVKQ